MRTRLHDDMAPTYATNLRMAQMAPEKIRRVTAKISTALHEYATG